MYEIGVARIQKSIKFSDMIKPAYILHPKVPDRLYIFDPVIKKASKRLQQKMITGKDVKTIKGDDQRMVQIGKSSFYLTGGAATSRRCILLK